MTRTALPIAAFAAFLGLWTWKLLEPSPVPEAVGEAIPADWKFVAAKCLHLGGYTFLTLLAALLPLTRRGFWSVAAALALHGIATEVLQHTLGWGRTGKVTDVLIDWGGIALGLVLLRVCDSRGSSFLRRSPTPLR